MYSSTIPTPSTIPVGDSWCRSISTSDISTHKSEYFIPTVEHNFEKFNRLTSKSIPLKIINSKKNNVNCKDLKQFNDKVESFLKEILTKKCMNWNEIRLKFREEESERKKCVKIFRNLKTPWYTSSAEIKKLPWPNTYYCYPKICVLLPSANVTSRDIIRYVNNGIFIFEMDLRFGTYQQKLKILKEIDRARLTLDEQRNKESVISIGFQINSTHLNTGLILHGNGVFLDRDSFVLLTAKRAFSHRCTHKVIYINFTDYMKRIKLYDVIIIEPKIKLQVVKIWAESVECQVINEGLLQSKMHVRLSIEKSLNLIDITTEEEEDVCFALTNQSDFLICPCLVKPMLTRFIRWRMATQMRKIITFAKINWNAHYLERDIDFIINEFVGIWIEGYNHKNRALYQYAVQKCIQRNKPIISVMDFKSDDLNLDDKQKKNCFLYPDCIAVPSVGSVDPIQVKSIIRKNYPKMNEDTLNMISKDLLTKGLFVERMILRLLTKLSLIHFVSCIIVCNNSGKSTAIIAQNRPLVPVIASICDVSTARNLMLLKNVIPFTYYDPVQTPWESELTDRINCCLNFAKSLGFVNESDPFYVCYDSARGMTFCDTFRLLYLE